MNAKAILVLLLGGLTLQACSQDLGGSEHGDGPDETPAEPQDGPTPGSDRTRITVTELQLPEGALLTRAGGSEVPLGAMALAGRLHSPFVLDEVVVRAETPAELSAALQAVGAEETELPSEPPYRVVARVRPEPVEPETLARLVDELGGSGPDEVIFSSPEAVALVALVARAELEGFEVDIDSVMQPSTFLDGRTEEAPLGSGFVDAFGYTYLSEGSNQDTGVTTAWDALERAGRLQRTVNVAVIDGGFNTHQDIVVGSHEAVSLVQGDSALGSASPSQCTGGTPCPWHGSGAAATIVGAPDNRFGAAGVAGPVIDRLITIHTQLRESMIEDAIRRARSEGADIISMSFGGTRSGFFGRWFSNGYRDFIRSVSDDRILVAAAGNDDTDVDAGEFWADPDPVIHVPCEVTGVVCVGALDNDATTRISYSNFSSQPRARQPNGTVDIYAPTNIRVGPYPGDPAGTVNTYGGTSAATPFTAGVFALALAADPSLARWDAALVVFDHAHRGTGRVNRWVDAGAAVTRILGNARPHVEIDTPNGDVVEEGWLRVSARTTDPDTDLSSLQALWSTNIDGVQRSLRTTPVNQSVLLELCDGTYDIEVQVVGGGATNPPSNTATRRVQITDRGSTAPPSFCAPSVQIEAPLAGAAYPAGQTITLSASIEDDQPQTDEPLYPVTWREGGPSGRIIGRGLQSSTKLGEGTHRISVGYGIAYDEVEIEVIGDNEPPSVVMVAPRANESFSYFEDGTWTGSGWNLELTLRALSNDPEDGPLQGASLQWEYRRVGSVSWLSLGSGAIVDVGIPFWNDRNQYEVRVIATDSAGLVATDTQRIVLNGPPN